MPPGRPPGEVFPGTYHREEAQGKTQDTLKGPCVSAGLGTSWDSPGHAGPSGWGEGINCGKSTEGYANTKTVPSICRMGRIEVRRQIYEQFGGKNKGPGSLARNQQHIHTEPNLWVDI
ncbi:hypothetical protein AMECASPLE_015330 [Ameca splendens]|uniref:Uncharacterized protein n=1 Tax=Ameca splendens TaxID=208324 RepID=A0ABV0Z021_9TELE